MPRPVTTLALERFDAATFGCQFASFATFGEHVLPPLRRSRSRQVATFWSRNATGSIFAMYASSSTACSAANADCGSFGARRNVTLK